MGNPYCHGYKKIYLLFAFNSIGEKGIEKRKKKIIEDYLGGWEGSISQPFYDM